MSQYQYKQEIKHRLKDYLAIVTEPSKGTNNYVCPICHSGLKANKTGALHYHEGKGKSPYVTCYACHEIEGDDIFSLIGKLEQIETFPDQYKRACQIFNYPEDMDPRQTRRLNDTSTEQTIRSYWESRGLTEKTRCRFNVTSTEHYIFTSKKENQIDCGKAIIIPYNKGSKYQIVRLINRPKFLNTNYLKEKGNTEEPCFNSESLKKAKPEDIIFITESPFCAMSIMQQSEYQAIALNGTGHNKLTEHLEDVPSTLKFVLCLDNDPPGEKASDELLKELTLKGFKAKCINICGNQKDPNEALINDSAVFTQAIQNAAQEINFNPDHLTDYLNLLFDDDINAYHQYGKKLTGFPKIDKQLGGLDPGLYILGGIPSIGKTTFALQMMYNFAVRGQHTLFFSLEQSRFEIATKLMSLYMFTMLKGGTSENEALSAREIMDYIGHVDVEIIATLKNRLLEISDYIEINEDASTTEEIEQAVQQNIECGNHPVIMIDYLQIIQGNSYRTKRDDINDFVHQLKKLSRKYNIIVLAISSLNRGSYDMPIDFDSYKESGGIEYGADGIFGLQYSITSSDNYIQEKNGMSKRKIIQKAKMGVPRKIDFVCLKGRNEEAPFRIPMHYYSKNNFFE